MQLLHSTNVAAIVISSHTPIALDDWKLGLAANLHPVVSN